MTRALLPGGSWLGRAAASLLRSTALCLLTCAWPATPASAQQVLEVRAVAENDNFNFWQPIDDRGDWEYTHGAWVSVTTAAAPGWGRWAPRDVPVCDDDARDGSRCLMTAWEVGQRIYTPRVNSAEPVPGQRPHAGWLYGSMTAISQQVDERHALRIEVGVTGPPTLAGPLQRSVHRALGFWEPLGWEHQLPFEPGIAVGYQYGRSLVAAEVAEVRIAEVTTSVGGTVGTVTTAGTAELDARFGFDPPRTWDVRVLDRSNASAYAIAGFRADAVLRNLFLDGNLFRSSLSVDKLPFVSTHYVGLAVGAGRWDASYRVTTRSREYRTEPAAHRYSTFVVTLRR